MSYTDLIEKADKKSRSTSIAIKIRDMMKNLRLSSNEESPRRWVWELLQNAKDVSYPDSKTKVQIELDLNYNYLKFSHNGKPFTAENITFLVGQVSSKEQVPYSGVGLK
ncbi:ATP-binding protein, partial [Stenotrophomonas maltophilia group sp. RNC7]|uniref:ATP-binding protein n=1 Tax=Stenotrophomonas maltophilia group sp. RNC7 TaxID=3071467 RepID=UPI0027E19F4D